MNKLYSFLLLTAVTFGLSARELSPSEALARVDNRTSVLKTLSKGSQAGPRLALEIKMPARKDMAALYLFDTGSATMIVSANDVAKPLLGWADNGEITERNMAPGLRYWLDFYAAQIEWAVNNNVATVQSAASESRAAVSPLIKTTWNQSAPYNNDCPEFSGSRSYTGCVATAMAQAMYFYQWPVKAQGGTVSYTSQYPSSQDPEFEKSISYNFDNATFDWSDMLLNYVPASGSQAANYNSTQAAAVAELMYACGVSVQMAYSTQESGAASVAIAPALYKYFNYAPTAIMPQRSFYTDEDWEALVYNELAQGNPVLYGGQSIDGGHQFICDGYQNGYYHFNWGWSGQSDGYYLLSALDPESQGAGGSTSGFNFDQDICIGLKTSATAPQYLICCSGNFMTEGLLDNEEEGLYSQTVSLGTELTIVSSNYFANFGCRAAEGKFGVLLTAADGSTTKLYATTSSIDVVEKATVSSYTVTLPSSLSAGTYDMTPIFLPEGESDPINVICPPSGVQSLTLTVEGSEATIGVGTAPQVTVSKASFKSEVYDGSYFSLDFTVANQGSTDYYGTWSAVLLQDNEEEALTEQLVPVSLSAGQTETFNLVGMFTSVSGQALQGEYQVVFVDATTNNVIEPQTTLTVNVNAEQYTEPQLSVSLTLDQSAQDIDASSIKFKGTVECTSGYFSGQLTLAIFGNGSSTSIYTTYTDFLFVGEGQSTTFDLNVDLGSVAIEGNTYQAGMYNGQNSVSSYLAFTVTSGLDDITAGSDTQFRVYPVPARDVLTIQAPAPIEQLDIYDLSGRPMLPTAAPHAGETTVNVSDYPAGHYFIVLRTANGETFRRHIIVD